MSDLLSECESETTETKKSGKKEEDKGQAGLLQKKVDYLRPVSAWFYNLMWIVF